MSNETLQSLVKQPAYSERFRQVLGDRAPQFVSSLLQIGNSLYDVEPRSILADYREIGQQLWGRFTTGSAEDQLWYYRELIDTTAGIGESRLVPEFRRTVEELGRLVSQPR